MVYHVLGDVKSIMLDAVIENNNNGVQVMCMGLMLFVHTFTSQN